MNVLLGILSVLISLLLFSYYQVNVNQDDYNRPSFFNSRTRIYFLLFIMVVLFIFGEYLIIRDKYNDFTWFVPLSYFVTFYIIRGKLAEDKIIKRLFQYHLLFSDPSVIKSEDDRLIAPAGFMLQSGKFSEEFLTRANEYLAKRVKEGKIKGPKDLPQEVWTIIHCSGKAEIVEAPELRISKRKIDYYFEEVVEGRKHHNFTKIIVSWLWSVEAKFERLFENFAFVALMRPDFTCEEIQLNDAQIFKKGKVIGDRTHKFAVFSQISAEEAKKFGWVNDLDEYLTLAALEFQRRFPKHPFSRKIKKQHKYSNQEIFDYAQNWVKLDISKIKLVPDKLLGK